MGDQELGEQGVALYYPHISIASEAWLKSTLLLWDSVRRIVPGGTVTEDAPGVAQLARSDLLVNTAPFDYTEHAERLFFGKLQQRDSDGVSLEDLLREDSSLPDPHIFTSAETIHVEKVSHGVLQHLEQLGLVTRTGGDWLQFDSRVGSLYMCCLATVMAGSLCAPLVTDHAPFLGWAHLFAATHDNAADPLAAGLAELSVEWPSVTDLAAVPTEKFLDFHHRRASERHAFRDVVRAVVSELRQIDDRNQLADAMAKHRRSFAQRLQDLRDAQQELGIKAVMGAMKFNCPTLIVAGAAAPCVGPVAGAFLIGGGLALSVASWAADLRSARRSLRRSDRMYYVLAVSGEL